MICCHTDAKRKPCMEYLHCGLRMRFCELVGFVQQLELLDSHNYLTALSIPNICQDLCILDEIGLECDHFPCRQILQMRSLSQNTRKTFSWL